jgi:hypothetical protein
MNKTRSHLLPLFAIFGCALIPLFSAYYLFFWPPEDLKIEKKHHGQLLNTPVKLSSILSPSTTTPSITTPTTTTPSNWQLATLIPADQCSYQPSEETFQEREQQLSSIITALGREAHRVELTKLCIMDNLATLSGNATLQTGIIDPMGYLIMLYPESANQRAIFQDMKRLLKYSKAG